MVEITEEFLTSGDFVVFGIDAHEEDDQFHPEIALFLLHNIIGTAGMELYVKLKAVYDKHRNDVNLFYFLKTRYSAFAGTNLELKLREREIEELHIIGVCTDICVLHTAVDAYNKGFKIV